MKTYRYKWYNRWLSIKIFFFVVKTAIVVLTYGMRKLWLFSLFVIDVGKTHKEYFALNFQSFWPSNKMY